MLRITASDMGELQGRKILFSTHTGEVLLKRLRKSDLAICWLSRWSETNGRSIIP